MLCVGFEGFGSLAVGVLGAVVVIEVDFFSEVVEAVDLVEDVDGCDYKQVCHQL